MEHIIPQSDEHEHSYDEECECRPRLIETLQGDEVCIHTPYDMRHLIQQAEAIRMFVSAQLSQKTDLTAPHQTYFFPNNEPINFPLAHNRSVTPL